MPRTICSCGKPAIFTGYCEDCEAILKRQLDRELRDEGIDIAASNHEFVELLKQEAVNPSPIQRFPEGSEPE